MPNKKTLAIYAAGGCGGCGQSLLLSPNLVLLLDRVDLLFWASSTSDLTDEEISAYDDRGIDLLICAGTVRGNESIATARLLRAKAKRVVAYGACAHLGGLCGLANVYSGAQLRALPNADGEFVHPLSSVIDVDYILPGCPPPQAMVTRMMEELFIADVMSEQGTVFASKKAVCGQCDRKHVQNPLSSVRRFHTAPPDLEICLIDQGYICLGPVTRGGCDAVCLKSNRPCTGCAGPVAGVRDQGGAILHALASLISFPGTDTEKKEHQVLDSIPDVIGTTYKYSVASSILKRRVNDGK